jgi:hypothetical protein
VSVETFRSKATVARKQLLMAQAHYPLVPGLDRALALDGDEDKRR